MATSKLHTQFTLVAILLFSSPSAGRSPTAQAHCPRTAIVRTVFEKPNRHPWGLLKARRKQGLLRTGAFPVVMRVSRLAPFRWCCQSGDPGTPHHHWMRVQAEINDVRCESRRVFYDASGSLMMQPSPQPVGCSKILGECSAVVQQLPFSLFCVESCSCGIVHFKNQK